ncbi:hypothetical protein PAXRUDRAFT_163541 [Paxillus rubicundulus Ve08.2h10]|uniref:Uncharacterized protein n=1 Tax=Paxillus rubicundulus Ve08.2h10 TaxID=930991 RepID=A0A0D0DK84_9AGAM|nr:hypothetical protein PAXRUDRAFT_163541 [Paxillus rubicundulus Ve08.2h10]
MQKWVLSYLFITILSTDGDCCRFATQSCHFMDAYHKALDGKQAAWVEKKFRGH